MRYVVDESAIDKGLYFVVDTRSWDKVGGNCRSKIDVEKYCIFLNEGFIMTPTQQHTERLRDCIKQVRSTLNQMERELETIEGIG